jgi:hypothetical protein|tara:strand:+ start:7916 stop:8605 length:690 start_codon:yes stop_codon:yes gene_type:complete
MNQSESIQELAKSLCLAQAMMGGAVKDSTNPFFNSGYADLASVIKVIKPAFAKHGLSFVQLPVTSEGGRGVGVSTMLMHESGEWLQGEYLLPMDKVSAQGAGSAITYARRYALSALCGIPQVDLDAEDITCHEEDKEEDKPVVIDMTSMPNELDMSLEGLENQPAAQPIKRVSKKLVQDVVALVQSSQQTNETSELVEALGELDQNEKQVIWKQLTGKQQDFVRLTRRM